MRESPGLGPGLPCQAFTVDPPQMGGPKLDPEAGLCLASRRVPVLSAIPARPSMQIRFDRREGQEKGLPSQEPVTEPTLTCRSFTITLTEPTIR